MKFHEKAIAHVTENKWLYIIGGIIFIIICWKVFKMVKDHQEVVDVDKTISLSKYNKLLDGKNILPLFKKWQEDQKIKATSYQTNYGGLPTSYISYISGDEAARIAKAIYDSKGFFLDDENAAIQSINEINSLADLNRVNVFFTKAYTKGKTIFDYFSSFMDPKQQALLADYLATKPLFIVSKRTL